MGKVRSDILKGTILIMALRVRTPRPDTTEALIALARAWCVTMIAVWLLLAALLLAPLWDRAIFLQAVRTALVSNSSVMLPVAP